MIDARDQLLQSGAEKVSVNIPKIASGGADAVLMASITHFGNYTITQMKEYLRDRGIPMNL